MNELAFARRVADQISSAFDWYYVQNPRAADAFMRELEHTLNLVRSSPGMFPFTQGATRRARLRRFPYKIFYRQHGKRIVVVSVVHEKRRPRNW